MKIKDANVTINVKELGKAVAFYESIGLTVQHRWGDHYAQLTAPGVVIGLHPTTTENLPGNSGNASIGFTVEDFEGSESVLKQMGVPFTSRQEEGGKFVHFKDPDGTALYFIQPKW